jgi:hypothetical protein
MRRAVILATLTCILFAVAGVTVAGENTFPSGSQDGDQTESTVPESTVAGRIAPEATASEATVSEATVPEVTVPETTVPEDVKKTVEGTEEATVVVHEEPKEPGKGAPGAGNYGGIQNDNRIEKAGEPTGKPEHAQGGKKYGKPRVAGKPPGKTRPCRRERVWRQSGQGHPLSQGQGDDLGRRARRARAPAPRRQTRGVLTSYLIGAPMAW